MYEMVAAACNIPMDQTIDFSCYYYLFGSMEIWLFSDLYQFAS
jgi:hypothetical protein